MKLFRVNKTKFLGVLTNINLTMEDHIDVIAETEVFCNKTYYTVYSDAIVALHYSILAQKFM